MDWLSRPKRRLLLMLQVLILCTYKCFLYNKTMFYLHEMCLDEHNQSVKLR